MIGQMQLYSFILSMFNYLSCSSLMRSLWRQVLKPKNETADKEEIDEDNDESIMKCNHKNQLEEEAAAATDEDANVLS